MTPEKFDYFAPTTLEEALRLLAEYGEDAKVLAGGQSLLAAMKLRLAAPKVLVDLNRIDELRGIRDAGDHVSIGAMTRYTDAMESDVVRRKCPLLPQTIALLADTQIRNRGTIGGSLAHADPAGDVPAAALALEVDLRVVGPHGERWIPATDFFVTTYTTRLEPDEILAAVRVPATERRSVYLKAARRPSDFAMVGVACVAGRTPDGRCTDVAVAVTGVGDHPYRATATERALQGAQPDQARLEAAAAAATDGVEVASDVHASSTFRAHLTRVYVTRALQMVVNGA